MAKRPVTCFVKDGERIIGGDNLLLELILNPESRRIGDITAGVLGDHPNLPPDRRDLFVHRMFLVALRCAGIEIIPWRDRPRERPMHISRREARILRWQRHQQELEERHRPN